MVQNHGNLSEQKFGNYRLKIPIGEGGFAKVYLGEHEYLKILRAVKVLQIGDNQQYFQAFVEEAQIVAMLEHPNIVKVLDFGVNDKTPFLIMHYVPRGALNKLYPEGTQLHLATILPYVKQVASALQYAHERNIIHCDVKPANMLLKATNEVLLSDFGLAVIAQHASPQIQGMRGTIAYTAPEQINGRPCPASDQYALGVVVYEWLIGRRPFEGNPDHIAKKHLHLPPPSLRKHIPTISSAVEQVVFRALAKNSEDRFETVKAFANALEEAYQQEKLVPIEEFLPPSKMQTHLKRSRWLIALVASLILLLISGSILIYFTCVTQITSFNLPYISLTQQNLRKTAKIAFINKANITATMLIQSTIEARATSTTLQEIYSQATRGNPVTSSPLKSQDNNKWDVHSNDVSHTCIFTGGMYHVSISKRQQFESCIARATSFSNFAFQVQMIIIKGDYGGIVFRASSINTNLYHFRIGTDGSYELIVFSNTVPQGKALQYGNSPIIHPQLDRPNEITVVANDSYIYLYVNQQYITSIKDNTLTLGTIGVTAEDGQDPTEIAFSDAKVWKLA